MEEDRRGFLKTLGKLTAAVGITAAASTLPAKGKELNHDEFMKVMETPGLTREEQQWIKDGKKVMQFQVPKPITHASNVCVTNRRSFFDYDLKPTRKAMSGDICDAVKATAEAQRTIDKIQNMRIDEMRMEMNPHMIVPREAYTYMNHERAMRDLDPYNWGKVFDLEWKDWHAADPMHATVTGIWVARVKPYFASCFENNMWYQSKSIAMDYLAQRVNKSEEVKAYAKDMAYRQLVDTLQDVILERIKRDVKSRS